MAGRAGECGADRETLVIEVQHLTKQYGRFTAVDDVSFRVDKGEILGFLGPNGAGKTTTMRILTGYMPATSGKAIIAGYDIFEQPIEAKRRIGYLPETPPLYTDMTVRDYLLFVGRIRGVASKALRAQVDTAMEKTRVADVANKHCGKLSKGYRQRVGLAQAILHNPEVLILDEPTAGLDPKQIMETRDLIKGLAGSHTIILSTHILPEVAQTCERVVIINRGKIAAVDTPAALTERIQASQTIYVQVDAPASVDVAAAIGGVPGVTRVTPVEQHGTLTSFEVDCHKGEDRRREVARLVVSSDWGLVELRPSRLSLEEVFLQLTTDEVAAAPPPAQTPDAAA
jgi:ABC-2 type transport system ATP-binding protein